MNGKITDIETMGSADGPGVRLVLFLAGCKLRCLYCHNPETWLMQNFKKEITSEEVLKNFNKYNLFFFSMHSDYQPLVRFIKCWRWTPFHLVSLFRNIPGQLLIKKVLGLQL